MHCLSRRIPLRTAWSLGLFALWMLAPVLSWASSASKAQVEKGHRMYQRKDFLGAVNAFGEAVRLDNRDIEALYWLGRANGGANAWEAAREAFLKASLIDPDYQDINLQLGAAYYRLAQHKEALEQLNLAERKDRANSLIPYYRGLVHHRLKNYRQSAAEFEKVMRINAALAPNSAYYAGLAYFRQNNDEEARRKFDAVQQLAPGTDLSRSAQEYLAAIEDKRPDTSWEIDIVLGAQYDDNLRIEADDYVDSEEGQVKEENDDIRRKLNVFAASAGYWRPWRNASWTTQLRYNLYKSYHPDQISEEDEEAIPGIVDNNRFDLLDIQPGLGADYNNTLAGMPWRLTFGYDYKASSLDGEAHLNEHKLLLGWKLAEHPDYTFTNLELGRRMVDYRQDFHEALSGAETRIGLSQYVFFHQRQHYLAVGLDYLDYAADKSAGGASYDHKGTRLYGAVHLPFVVVVDLKASVENRDFDNYLGTGVGSEKRKDTITTWGASISPRLGDHFAVYLGYHSVKFDSLDAFTYTRNIVTFSLAALI